jgi:hypothetical protein
MVLRELIALNEQTQDQSTLTVPIKFGINTGDGNTLGVSKDASGNKVATKERAAASLHSAIYIVLGDESYRWNEHYDVTVLLSNGKDNSNEKDWPVETDWDSLTPRVKKDIIAAITENTSDTEAYGFVTEGLQLRISAKENAALDKTEARKVVRPVCNNVARRGYQSTKIFFIPVKK